MIKEGVKDEFRTFFKTIYRSCLPSQYPELSKRDLTKGMQFFTSVLLLIFLISFVLLLPKLFAMPNNIGHHMSKFDTLSLNINASMNDPILIPENNPRLIIDTTGQYTGLGNEKFLITGENLFFKSAIGKRYYDFSEYKDFTEDTEKTSDFLYLLFLLMLPGFVIASYFFMLIKILLVILAFSAILYIIIYVAKHRADYISILKAGLYSSILLMVLEMINLFFNFYYVHYAIFFVFYLVNVFSISRKPIRMKF